MSRCVPNVNHFISHKRPCAFCGADNGLRPSEDCDSVFAGMDRLYLGLMSLWLLARLFSHLYLTRMTEYDGILSGCLSSAFSVVKSSLSTLTKSISSLEHRIAPIVRI